MSALYTNGARLFGGGGALSSGGGSINSIQTFSIQLTSGNLSGNTTISSITKANTIMRVDVQSLTASQADKEAVTFDITTTTNLAAQRSASGANSVTYYVELLEFNTGSLTSNQFVSSTSTSQTQINATITAVDTTKAFAFFHGTRNDQGGLSAGLLLGSAEVTSSTNVRFRMDLSALPSNQTTLGQVVEFV